MTITFEVPKAAEKALERLAASKGVPVEQLVSSMSLRDLDKAAALDELLKPIREEFAANGIGEDEALSLFENAREAVWEDRQKAANSR